MKLLKKDKKEEKFKFGNYRPSHYQPDDTMTMPVGGIVDEVNRRLGEQERTEEKLGFIEKTKMFLNKTWIRFSKLFICILAPTIYGLERFYWNKYNFIIFAGNYMVVAFFSWVALNDWFKKKK